MIARVAESLRSSLRIPSVATTTANTASTIPTTMNSVSECPCDSPSVAAPSAAAMSVTRSMPGKLPDRRRYRTGGTGSAPYRLAVASTCPW